MNTNVKMVPFNLEKAKKGHPVCTRDGKSVNILCFDNKSSLPIIALVGENELLYEYDIDGKLPLGRQYRNEDLRLLK